MPGIVQALSSAALFGAGTPLAKALLGNIDPWMLAGLLYLGSGLGLGLILAIRRLRGGPSGEAPLAARDLPRLAAVVLCGGVVGPAALMVGLSAVPASTASLLLNLEGLLTLGIAWVVFRENVDRRVGIGAGFILAGALVLSWTGGGLEGGGWGTLAIAGACLAWAIDNNLTRDLSSADPIQLAAIKGGAAGIVNVLLALWAGSAFPAVPGLLGAAGVGFLSYGLSLTLFVSALRRLGTARTGAYFSLAPFAGAATAILVFGESPTIRLGVAAALMAAGLIPHLTERHAHRHRHEPLRHDHRHVHDEHHRHDHDGPEGAAPHSHPHEHPPLEHSHVHYPDIHHRHEH